MKEVEIVKNQLTEGIATIDFKYGETEIKFRDPITSFAFWEVEKQANRAQLQIKKLNPKITF